MKRSRAFPGLISLLIIFPQYVSSQSKIHGIVTDVQGKPVAAATVLLLQSMDSMLVKGTMTSNTGEYTFENIVAGRYFISGSSIGHSPISSSVFQVTRKQETYSPGTLVMEPVSSSLQNVTVVARKPMYEQKPDRLLINVASSITSAGKTALEVLERSPGVSVNRQQSTISILGKDGVYIMINGKMNYLPPSAVVQMLDGMSAGNIERIELITTPPSSLDAEGKAGYINIVLKQNENFGTNGSFSATVGYGKGWNTQANVSFNHRSGKINLFGSLSYTRRKKPFRGSTYSRISNGAEVYDNMSVLDRTDTTRQHAARVGIDYQINSNTIIGLLITSNGRWYRQTENTSSYFYVNNHLDTVAHNFNTELNDWQDYGVNLNLQKNFKNSSSISFNAWYLHYKNNQPFNYFSQYYDDAGHKAYDEITRNLKKTPMNFWIGSIDYSRQLSKKLNLEAGVKSTLADFTNELQFDQLINSKWINDTALTSLYTLKENYSAVYASLNVQASEKTNVQAGLRYEYTNTNLESEAGKTVLDRHYGKFFPTLFVSHKLSDDHAVNASFSIRISRPKFNQIAPFTYYTNRRFVLTGNPGLQPAISKEVTAGYSFKKYIFKISYSHEDDAIADFQADVDSVANKTVSRPENLRNQKLVTAMLVIPVNFTRWWTMQFTTTGIWQQINALYKGDAVSISQKNVMLNMSHTFILPKEFTVELTGFYQSKSLDGINVFKPFGSLDIGIRKKMGKQSTLTFSGNNLLNTLDFRGYTDLPDQNLVGDVHIRFSWRTFNLTYTRSFGNNKLKESRSRKTGAEEEKNRVQYQ